MCGHAHSIACVDLGTTLYSKNHYLALSNFLARQQNWQHRKRTPLTDSQRYWLRGNQSLTKQLIQHSNGNFDLEVIREIRAIPFAHEARVLGLPFFRSCLIREVVLFCNDQAVVFARSIISDRAIKASQHQLTKLGNIPLGHLLFNQARVNLETRQIMRFKLKEENHFGRRTLYQLNGEDILVSEFFLMSL